MMTVMQPVMLNVGPRPQAQLLAPGALAQDLNAKTLVPSALPPSPVNRASAMPLIVFDPFKICKGSPKAKSAPAKSQTNRRRANSNVKTSKNGNQSKEGKSSKGGNRSRRRRRSRSENTPQSSPRSSISTPRSSTNTPRDSASTSRGEHKSSSPKSSAFNRRKSSDDEPRCGFCRRKNENANVIFQNGKYKCFVGSHQNAIFLVAQKCAPMNFMRLIFWGLEMCDFIYDTHGIKHVRMYLSNHRKKTISYVHPHLCIVMASDDAIKRFHRIPGTLARKQKTGASEPYPTDNIWTLDYVHRTGFLEYKTLQDLFECGGIDCTIKDSFYVFINNINIPEREIGEIKVSY